MPRVGLDITNSNQPIRKISSALCVSCFQIAAPVGLSIAFVELGAVRFIIFAFFRGSRLAPSPDNPSSMTISRASQNDEANCNG
jgi:hypothetical protein